MNKCDLLWKPEKTWQKYSIVGFIILLFFYYFAELNALPAYSGMGYVLSFAILVIVPFALSLITFPMTKNSWIYRYLKWFHLPSALCAIFSLTIEETSIAGFLAFPWFIQTLAIMSYGITLVLSYKNHKSLPLISVAMGCFYIPIAGSWLIISNLGFTLGFRPTIVFLTAIHFHFAGFALSLLVGIIGFYFYHNTVDKFYLKIYNKIAGVVIFSPILVAVGISFSRFIEMVSSIILGISIISISAIVFLALKNINKYTRALFLVSCIAMVGTMSLAGIYATSQYLQIEIISISQMIYTHGILNAFGFTFCSLLGWNFIMTKEDIWHDESFKI